MTIRTILRAAAIGALDHALRDRSHWWPRLGGAAAVTCGTTLLLA